VFLFPDIFVVSPLSPSRAQFLSPLPAGSQIHATDGPPACGGVRLVAPAAAEPRGAVGGAAPRGPAAPRLRVALRPRGRGRGGRQRGGRGGGDRRRGEGGEGTGRGEGAQAATRGAAGAAPACPARAGAQQRRALRRRGGLRGHGQDCHRASRPRQAPHAGTRRANHSLRFLVTATGNAAIRTLNPSRCCSHICRRIA
jgi:hypothetical protein